MSRTFLLLAIIPLAVGCASTDQDREQARRDSSFARDQSRREEMHRRIDERIDAVAGQLRREMHELVDSTTDNRRRAGGSPVIIESPDGRTRTVFGSGDAVRSRLATLAEGPFTTELFEGKRMAEKDAAKPKSVKGWTNVAPTAPAGPKGPSAPRAPKLADPRLRLGRSIESAPSQGPATSRPSEFRRLRVVQGDGKESTEEVQDLDFKVILDRAKQEVELQMGELDLARPSVDTGSAPLRYRVVQQDQVEVVPAEKAESRPIIRRKAQ